jgi:general secretion pathway protein I
MGSESRSHRGGPWGRIERGMTLIEVLVALAIVAITLAAGFKAAGGLTVNAQRLSDLTVANWCAENHLAALVLTKEFPATGDSDFQCEQLGRELRGSRQVRGTPNPNFRRVDAQVFDELNQPIVRLSTVVSNIR